MDCIEQAHDKRKIFFLQKAESFLQGPNVIGYLAGVRRPHRVAIFKDLKAQNIGERGHRSLDS